MAGEGVQNMVSRRVTDDLIIFSGETSPSRDYIAQLNAVVAEFEAMKNKEEVHDSWLAAKDARRGEQGRLDGLNEVIDDALEEIEKLKINVEILKGAADMGSIWVCVLLFGAWQSVKALKLRLFICKMGCRVVYNSYIFSFTTLIGIHGAFFILDQLAEIAESLSLGDKMKYVFERSHGKDESLSRIMVDLCIAYRVSLGKKRKLIAELEAAGKVDGAAKCLEHIKVIVARDAVTLGDLQTVWVHCQVGKSLKAGFVANNRRSLVVDF
nr:hypothetical protein [Tanacetum cinerariifolium]